MFRLIDAFRMAVILLLTLRVIAAPFAVRPQPLANHGSSGVVVRICAWPPQRAQSVLDKLSRSYFPRDGQAESPGFDAGHALPENRIIAPCGAYASVPLPGSVRFPFAERTFPMRC